MIGWALHPSVILGKPTVSDPIAERLLRYGKVVNGVLLQLHPGHNKHSERGSEHHHKSEQKMIEGLIKHSIMVAR